MFVLQDNFLHYYLEADDAMPKKSMDLCGCSIVPVKAVKLPEGSEFFPFVISHPKSTKTYKLSCDDKEQAEEWIEKMTIAAAYIENPLLTSVSVAASSNTNTVVGKDRERERDDNKDVDRERDSTSSSTTTSPVTAVSNNNNSNSNNSDMETPSAATPTPTLTPTPTTAITPLPSDGGLYKPLHIHDTLANLPCDVASKIDLAVNSLVSSIATNAPGWEPLFEKNGITALKRPGAVICVRGDGVLPFALPDVLSMLLNLEKMRDFNAQLLSAKLLMTFSATSGVQVLKFKQVGS